MPKKRIAELHALERSPIAKKLWFFIHLRNLEVSWLYFRPSTALKGLALTTSCLATFWQLLLFGATFWQLLLFGATFWQVCHFEQLLILGANWLNFKQHMAIKKPYNTVSLFMQSMLVRKFQFSQPCASRSLSWSTHIMRSAFRK